MTPDLTETLIAVTRERDQLRSALRLSESAFNALRWIALTERLPTEDDANEHGDVEWSDGKDIWQAQWHDTELATHWRGIVLP